MVILVGDVERANGDENFEGDDGRSSCRGAGGIERPLACRDIILGIVEADEILGERAVALDEEEAGEADEPRLLFEPKWPSPDVIAIRGEVLVLVLGNDPAIGDLCSSDAL